MSSFKLRGIVPLAMLVFAEAAAAADLPQQWPGVMKAPLFVEEYSSGVYVRTDGGFRLNKFGEVTAIPVAPATPATLSPLLTNPRIDNSWTAGAGFGYKAGWLRADVTVDYAVRAPYKADTPDFVGKIESITSLTNGYIDLGTWAGFTPYVGGGAGVAYVLTRGFDTSLPAAKWKANFAWAYGGGVSYGLSAKFLIDLNYRHLSYGDAPITIDAAGSQVAIKDLSAHEFRAGLRYVLD